MKTWLIVHRVYLRGSGKKSIRMDTNTRSSFPNWKNWQVALATSFVVLVGLAFWLIFRFRIVFFILFISIVISIAITPAVDWLQNRRLPRAAGVILIYFLMAAFVIGFILLVAPLVLEQSTEIGNAMPEYYQDLRQWLLASPSLLVRRVGLELPRTLPWSPSEVPEAGLPPPNEVENEEDADEDILTQVTELFNFAGLALRGIFSSIAVFLLAFYWTLEGERVIRSLILLLPNRHREGGRELIANIQVRVGGYIRGVFLLSLIVGGMATAAYTIIGLPYALSLGIIAGIMEAVPILGPALGALPAIFVAVSLGDVSAVIAVLVATGIIQLLENTLFGPRVMNKSVGVNPILTLLAIATFTSLLGIPGALLAVPIAAVFQLLLERLLKRSRELDEGVEGERDPVAALRLELRELTEDVRKNLREKEGPDLQSNEQVEDEIEEIANELERILAETKQRPLGRMEKGA
jgi:predicted PurR-regulated permease PerM